MSRDLVTSNIHMFALFDYVPQDYHRRERRLFACDSMKHCVVVFALCLFLAVIRQSAVTQFSCSVFRVDFRRSLPSGLRSSGVGDKSGTSVFLEA